MKLKKWLALGLTFALAASSVFALAACDNDTPTPDDDDNKQGNIGDNPGGDNDNIVYAQDFDEATEGLVYTEVYDNNNAVIGYSVGIGTATEETSIYVPAVYEDGKPIISIGVDTRTFEKMLHSSGFDAMSTAEQISYMQQYTISYTEQLTSIHLPETLKSFGYAAFMQCYALQEIEIPKRITEIPDYTFMLNISLSKVTFAANDKITYIGGWAFYDCISLSDITLPDSVDDIDQAAFSMSGTYDAYGKGLSTIDFGTGVGSIGKEAFRGCGLTTITLPDSLAEMDESAFYLCRALKSVRIGKGLRTIPKEAFWGCEGLTTVSLGAVRRIEENAFSSCTALTSINFGDSLEIIGTTAFFACTALEKVVLPDSIQQVGRYAFQACSKLEYVWLGSNLWNVEENAFASKGNNMMPGHFYFHGTSTEYAAVEGSGKPNSSIVQCIPGDAWNPYE